MSERVFCCCSGGVDSTVMVAKLRSEGYDPKPIYVKFGQKTMIKEIEALARCFPQSWRTIELDLSSCIKGWSTEAKDDFVPVEGTDPELLFIPGRNIFVLLRLCVAAYYEDVHYLAIGNHATDRVCGDCKPPFLESFQQSLSLGMSTRDRDYPVTILRPIEMMTKAEVTKWGAEHQVPLEDTWSCYDIREHHCGKCWNCVDRKEAFQQAGIKDPTTYLE